MPAKAFYADRAQACCDGGKWVSLSKYHFVIPRAIRPRFGMTTFKLTHYSTAPSPD